MMVRAEYAAALGDRYGIPMKKTGSDDGITTMVGSDRDGELGRFRWQRRLWSAAAVLLVALGSTGAVVAAGIQSRSDAAKARQTFVSSSQQVASTLKLAIQHEADLVVSAGGFVAANPNASNRQFVQWANSVRALQRYPELFGLGHVVIVPAAKLAAFAARALRDPVTPLPADSVFTVLPPGHRSSYCLLAGAIYSSGALSPPPGYDFCDTGQSSLAGRDSGATAYQPLHAGSITLLSVMAPVYRDGLVPPTIAARDADFRGWVGLALVPNVLLDQALAGAPGTAVRFSYHVGSSNVAFNSGKIPSGAQSVTVELHNGWTVRTFAADPATGILATGSARELLLTGIALSVLLGALVFVLGTGRARAWRLVDLKTGELLHQALHDGLTGLPNRALITDRVEQLLARSRRNGTAGAVMFVDLDEFKNVNDTLGHEAGDQLLQAVAARLTGGLRSVDTIGRLGGDEFVVLVDGESQIAPELVAERLVELLREPFELDCSPTPIMLTTSVGIAVGERTAASELLRDADMALYRAKATGKNCYEVFRPEMETALRRELELELDLRSALAHDQFRLVYQPIYNLDDLSLVGIEALLRWDHPSLGVIAPDDFIPLLESSGQILEVGRWVLNTACQQMADWHAHGSTLWISVNVSGRQLDDDIIVADVRDALELSGLDPTKLTIEITETALMNNVQATSRRLHEIKALAVSLAIDDFGTGYSSLASLQQFPIDMIKIDRAFTDALRSSPHSDALIRILVQLGKDLGLNTLAEGVETIDQLDHLRTEHVDDVQGFLLSKPLQADALQALILPELAPARRAPSGT
jgi:diguanylate cyclase (GGDEF)-like protein